MTGTQIYSVLITPRDRKYSQSDKQLSGKCITSVSIGVMCRHSEQK